MVQTTIQVFGIDRKRWVLLINQALPVKAEEAKTFYVPAVRNLYPIIAWIGVKQVIVTLKY